MRRLSAGIECALERPSTASQFGKLSVLNLAEAWHRGLLNESRLEGLRQFGASELQCDKRAIWCRVDDRTKSKETLRQIIRDEDGRAFVSEDTARGHRPKRQPVRPTRPGEA